jgi:hypothetical protein
MTVTGAYIFNAQSKEMLPISFSKNMHVKKKKKKSKE